VTSHSVVGQSHGSPTPKQSADHPTACATMKTVTISSERIFGECSIFNMIFNMINIPCQNIIANKHAGLAQADSKHALIFIDSVLQIRRNRPPLTFLTDENNSTVMHNFV
jgi:hypothetical protein